MKKVIAIASATILFASTLLVSQAQAVPGLGTVLNTAYPGKNLYTGSCLTCHANSTGDDISVFYNYGNILRTQGVNYDSPTSFLPAIQRAGLLDFDNDGFTINQEVEGGSFSNGGLSGSPALIFRNVTGVVADANGKAFGLATSPAPATLNSLSSTLNNSTYITVPIGHRNIVSGVVDYTLNNVTTSGAVKLLFSTGGIQANPTVQFINTVAGTATAITASALDADGGSWVVGNDGSISVTIDDGGAFDLYSTANFQAEAVARSINFTPTTVFDVYANVSPDAQISPLAIVDANATIDAYAIVDAYATLTATANIGSYAYVAPNVYVNAIVDPYVSASADVYTQASLPNPVGTVQSRLAITTAAPAVGTVAGGQAGDNGDDGGLHCMTSGLSTYAFMLFGLLAAGLLAKRKPS